MCTFFFLDKMGPKICEICVTTSPSAFQNGHLVHSAYVCAHKTHARTREQPEVKANLAQSSDTGLICLRNKCFSTFNLHEQYLRAHALHNLGKINLAAPLILFSR